MKKFILELAQRLTSRKFLLTLATALVLVANKQWQTLAVLVGGYVGVEGIGDAAARYSAPKAQVADAELQATKIQVLGAEAIPDAGVDKSQFVVGGMAGQ